MPRFRHITLVAAGSVAVAIALAGCGTVSNTPTVAPAVNSAPTDLTWKAPTGLSGELNLYSANPQGLTTALVTEFTKETGVKVNVYAADSGTVTARLDSEWSNPQADLVYLASWAPAANYASQGKTLDYKPFGIDTIRDGWEGPKDGFEGRDGSALGLVVNTSVSPSIPKDWSDLAKPAFKDKVLMPDPRQSGTAADLITAMVAANGKAKTWKLFDSLFANGLVVQGANGPALSDVTAGSHAVVLGGVDYSAYTSIAAGEALKLVFPSSGTTITPRPVFILKTSKNLPAAKAFEDFMFSQQGQAISSANDMIPAQPSVPVATDTRTFDSVKQLKFTWADVTKTETSVMAEFTKRYLS